MVFIYKILKIIFFTRFFKKSQFFYKKKKQFFKHSLDCLKVNNYFLEYEKYNVDYLYLSSCMHPLIITSNPPLPINLPKLIEFIDLFSVSLHFLS